MKNYSAIVEVAKTAKDVLIAITDVTNWWSKDFEGKSNKLDDEFIINHLNQHYSKQKLVEVIPYKKIVWLVTESNLNWIKKHKDEWTGTKMIFDITDKGDKTILHFTHEGLTPEKECYRMCAKGWTMIITDWLFHLITSGTASKEMNNAAEMRNKALKDVASYNASIAGNFSVKEAFEGICKVNEWWGHIEGKTEKTNDLFTYRHNDTWVNFKITAFNDNRIVWHVTDCHLPWLNNKTEWLNTDVVFEISKHGNLTEINFTHVGLVPEIECYENCRKGWTHYIKTSLLQLLTTGKGQLK
jgi:hypothetical protein